MDIEIYKSQMQKALNHLENEFSHLQLGRASSSLVEGIKVYVPAYDMTQNLRDLGNITIVDAQTIDVQPWDKSTLSHIEKGIRDSGLGLNPLNHGDKILIKIPPLTQERRQDLTKIAHKLGEEAKISIRNIRQDANKEIKKGFEDKTISENEKGSFESKIDEATKNINTQIDDKVKNKSAEIMKI